MSCCPNITIWFPSTVLTGLDSVTPTVMVGPTPRPDVVPLPPGTHLLFAQNGKIEHIPVEGFSMKKSEAKTLLHVPVRFAKTNIVFLKSQFVTPAF